MLFGHQDTTQPSAPADPAVSSTGMTGMPQDTAPVPQVPVQQAATPQAPAPDTNPLATDPDTGISFPALTSDAPHDTEPQTSVLDQPSAPGYSAGTSVDNDPAPTSPFGSPQAQATVPSLDAPEPASQGAPMAHLTPAFSEESAATAPEASAAPDLAPQPIQTGSASSQSFADYSAAQQPAATATDTPTVVASDDLIELKRQALTDLGPLVGDLEQTPEEKFRTTMMLIQTTDNAGLLKAAYEAAHAIPDEKARAQALLDVVNEINYFTQQSSPDQQ